MVCDSWLVDSHLFWGVLYFKVHCFQAIIDLFAAKPFFRSFLRKCSSLVKIKQSLPSSLDKNTITISFTILNSQDLFSVLFLRQIALWFENPKSLQSLQNAQRDTVNFTVNKETLGTFVPKHQRHVIYFLQNGLVLERWPRRPPWKALHTRSSARELAWIPPCTFWHVYVRWVG